MASLNAATVSQAAPRAKRPPNERQNHQMRHQSLRWPKRIPQPELLRCNVWRPRPGAGRTSRYRSGPRHRGGKPRTAWVCGWHRAGDGERGDCPATPLAGV